MDRLETPRLLLEKWRVRDAQALYEYASDPAVGPPAGWKPHASVRESKRIIRKVFIPGDVWKIVLKETGRPVGSIGFDADRRRPTIRSRELGYSLSRSCWGQGLMPEAVQAVLEYGFVFLSLDLIAVTTGPDNLRSQRVIEKAGFHYEGTERLAYRIYDNSIRDLRCYSLLSEEWRALQPVSL
ncbi:MAG: GNAT family N-acetyltransferase [Anaerovoracaceae bacterium]|jgi:ribosomal-protein-alanine N-acetyltransferase